jgi:hypothetical protein
MVGVGGGGGEVKVVSCAAEGVADITSAERTIKASAAYLKVFISFLLVQFMVSGYQLAPSPAQRGSLPPRGWIRQGGAGFPTRKRAENRKARPFAAQRKAWQRIMHLTTSFIEKQKAESKPLAHAR